MEYQILENCCRYNLEQEVRRLIFEGWNPLGGVQMSVTVEVSYQDYGALQRVETWAQALTREQDGPV